MNSGCLGPIRPLFPPPPESNHKTVYVVHRGLHAGLVLPREEVPPDLWPAPPSPWFHDTSRFLEVGWGDAKGYRFEWTAWIVVRAVFWPTPAVLLARGFDRDVIEDFSDRAEEIIVVQLSAAGLARMCEYIQSYYRLDAQGDPIPLEFPFYAAKGKYHLFNNSNHWTARALRQAGCPITPIYAVTPGNVMFQTRKFGRVIWVKGESHNPRVK